jgi:DNA-directed RNA polymerase specialized sigma subunit
MAVPLEIFFTLPKLDDGSNGAIVQWITDPRLRRHVKELIQQEEAQATEEALAQVFLNILKQEPGDRLNGLHLVAFLSRFGYKAAWQARNDISNIGRLASDSNAQFKDLLQIAFEESSKPAPFFKNFDFKLANDTFWYSALKKYSHGKMVGILRDRIRTSEGMETFKRSNLSLATRSSKKRVIEALKYAGESEKSPQKNLVHTPENAEESQRILDRYLLAWECFKEVKSAEGISISAPKPEQFQEIANRYNLLSSENKLTIDGSTAEKWLKEIGAAIRSYIDRRVDSIDAPRNDEESPSLVEGLADEPTVTEWGTLSSSEVSEAAQQVKAFLYNLFASLDKRTQAILLLAHGLKLSQKETADELGINNQSAVSRSRKKILTDLLLQLGTWVQAQQGIRLSSETLNSIKGYLEEHLDEYYASTIELWFREILFALDPQSQEILRRRYAVLLDESTIAAQLQISTEKVSEVLANTRQSVSLAIAERQKNITEIAFKPEGRAMAKLLEMWEEWLKIAAYTGQS